MRCSGLGRRTNKTVAEKEEEERLYDMAFRQKNLDILKKKKAAYYQRIHDPVKEAITRKKRMHLHVEYGRRPENKAWKREYARFRASEYGRFADSHQSWISLVRELNVGLGAITFYRSDYAARCDASCNNYQLEGCNACDR